MIPQCYYSNRITNDWGCDPKATSHGLGTCIGMGALHWLPINAAAGKWGYSRKETTF